MFRISNGAEGRLNAGAGERGEEVLQVHPQYAGLADVRGSEGQNRAAFDKAVSSRMGRNQVQDAFQNLLLQTLQAAFRRFNQAESLMSFRQNTVMIVVQPRPVVLRP
jgi:hypothetical protein